MTKSTEFTTLSSSAYLAVAENNVFIGSKFAQAHRPAGVQFVRRYTDLRAHAEFSSVGKARRGVEIDGGEFVNGAHNRGSQMARDYEKRNAAIELGWAIFQLTGAMVKNDPVGWAERVKAVIAERLDSSA